jgi:hypothetical protein
VLTRKLEDRRREDEEDDEDEMLAMTGRNMASLNPSRRREFLLSYRKALTTLKASDCLA